MFFDFATSAVSWTVRTVFPVNLVLIAMISLLCTGNANAAESSLESPDGTWEIVLMGKPGVQYRPQSCMQNGFDHVDAWVKSKDGKKKILLSPKHAAKNVRWVGSGAKVVFIDFGSLYLAEAPTFLPRIIYRGDFPKEGEYWSEVSSFKVDPEGAALLFTVTGGGLEPSFFASLKNRVIVPRILRVRCEHEQPVFDLDSSGRVTAMCPGVNDELPLWCRRMTENGVRIENLLAQVAQRYPEALSDMVLVGDDRVVAFLRGAAGPIAVSHLEKTGGLLWNDGRSLDDALRGKMVPQELTREIVDLAMAQTKCTDEVADRKALLTHEKWLWFQRRTFDRANFDPMPTAVLPFPLPESTQINLDLTSARDEVNEAESEQHRNYLRVLRAWCQLDRMLEMSQGKLQAARQCAEWQKFNAALTEQVNRMQTARDVVARFVGQKARSSEEKDKVCGDFFWAFSLLANHPIYAATKEMCTSPPQQQDADGKPGDGEVER